MPDAVVDSSPSADDSHIRIAIGKDMIAALDALIQAVDALPQVDPLLRPLPRRPALIGEAICHQVRQHRALRAQGQAVPLPVKRAGPYWLGNVPRRLHALLVTEQAQLKAAYPAHTVALPDLVDAGIHGIIAHYRQIFGVSDPTEARPPRAPATRASKINLTIGFDSLKALDTYIQRREHAAAAADLAERVPAPQEWIDEAIREQILRHRALRAQGQPVPIPLRAAGEFALVQLRRPLHAMLREEQKILQAEHQDDLEYTISLREIAEAGIDALLPADLRRRARPVVAERSPRTKPSSPRWQYLNPKLLVDADVFSALTRLTASHQAVPPGSAAPTVRDLVEQALQRFLTQHGSAPRVIALAPDPLDPANETTVRITRDLMTHLQEEARRQSHVQAGRVTAKQMARAILASYLADQGIPLAEPGSADPGR